MQKLTKTQKRLLETAAARDDGTLLPIPNDLTLKGGKLTASLKSLASRGLVERPGSDSGEGWRITEAGCRSVGREPPRWHTSKRVTKADEIVDLLSQSGGATMPDIVRATRWQAHSVRAAISGLRKRGLAVIRTVTEEGVSHYRIAEAGQR